MSKIEDYEWLEIIKDLKDQKTVLLIGPDIATRDGVLMNQALHQHLMARCRSFITYYYERDGIYLFDAKRKVKIARTTSEFYESVQLEDALLQRIVQIPFDLILSINPDTAIADAFHQYSVPRNFYFFQHGEQGKDANNIIEKPTTQKPVVYNLFGLKEQDESFVLDYNDLYKMLKSLLGTPGLPTKLSKKLHDARTYIFLGFQFDKWYAQLLLKLLQDDSPNDKILSLNGELKDSQTNQFVISQFEIQFLNPEFNFFGELHKQCEKAKILRGVIDDSICAEAATVLRYIRNAQFDDALAVLSKAAQGKDWANDVIATQARYSHLKKDNAEGGMDSRDYRTESAKIINTIIELSKNVCP